MPTLFFKVLTVLVIISYERRQIKHIAVTTHPSADWVVQQLREATPYGDQPKYLIHDNDSIFRGNAVAEFLKNAGIPCKRTAYKSPWQNGVVERVIGTLRRELLDHLIPLDAAHLQQLLTEYVQQYYHPKRTHQANNRQTPIPPAPPPAPAKLTIPLQAEPILGGLYHNYRRAA